MKLTTEQYGTIRRWLYRNARPLDLARWRYHFEGGSEDEVLLALSAYENPDGGYGHALEPDCWNVSSSPMQTWWATQFIKEIKLENAKNPNIQGIIDYLGNGHSYEADRWLNTIPTNNDYPGAPWWRYNPGSEVYRGFNPSVALAGFILKYANRDTVLFQKAVAIIQEAATYFMTTEVMIEMHELACFSELHGYLETTGRESLIDFEGFTDKLKKLVYETIEHDSLKWATEYCCKPSHYCRGKNSIFYEENRSVIEQELDMILNTLNEEGVWDVTWQWGCYDKEFAVSSRWWQANIAITNMIMLRDFERIA